MAKRITPKQPNDVPTTQGMLAEFRGEMMSRFISMDHRFHSMDQRFKLFLEEMKSFRQEIRSDMSSLRGDLMSQMVILREELGSDIQKAQAEVHRVGLLVETQESRNRYALDGYANLYERVIKLENG